MTKPMIAIHDLTIDEITTRKMNAEEFAQYQSEMTSLKVERDFAATNNAEKQAILDQLGITAEQAKLLLS